MPLSTANVSTERVQEADGSHSTLIMVTAGAGGFSTESLVTRSVAKVARTVERGSNHFKATLRTHDEALAAEWWMPSLHVRSLQSSIPVCRHDHTSLPLRSCMQACSPSSCLWTSTFCGDCTLAGRDRSWRRRCSSQAGRRNGCTCCCSSWTPESIFWRVGFEPLASLAVPEQLCGSG